jgi:hypothetical protein
MARCQFQLRLSPGKNEKSAPPYLFSFGEEVFFIGVEQASICKRTMDS